MTYPMISKWADVLGWTLLHSLWQGAAISLLIFVLLQLLRRMSADSRYALACSGFALFIGAVIATAAHLGMNSQANTAAHSSEAVVFQLHPSDPLSQEVSGDLLGLVQHYLDWMLLAWAVGVGVFTIRFVSGVRAAARLRAGALPINDQWKQFISSVANDLGIRRPITLAESASIASPIVIGYLKPMILIPLGMAGGMSTDQIETVLLHELAHIRRHDYLINMVQVAVETMFFFNPFVWWLSGIIRKEREYCCDEFVVRRHGSAHAYANALVRLAEAELTYTGFAMTLSNNKNQLLQRIRKIMAKSVDKSSGARKFVLPALLLVAGLMCISWLGMQKSGHPDDIAQTADTIPPKKPMTATYSRKSVIKIDKDGQPHEEVVEEFEGDEQLRPLLKQGLPDITLGKPDATLDTIPPYAGRKTWEEMARMLDEQFKMFDADSMFSWNFSHRFEPFQIPDVQSFDNLESSELFKHMEEELERLRMMDFDGMPGVPHRLTPRKGYEETLRDELKKDGYLNENESIESLEWSNKSFKVNGKSIRESDKEKYLKLNNKFFGGGE